MGASGRAYALEHYDRTAAFPDDNVKDINALGLPAGCSEPGQIRVGDAVVVRQPAAERGRVDEELQGADAIMLSAETAIASKRVAVPSVMPATPGT